MKKKLSAILIFAGLVNFVLFLIKLYIGIRTNSLCIYTDSINNLMDAISVILAIIGVAFITKPSTPRHIFGFGRMEYVTSFLMSLVMTGAGLSFAYNCVERIFTPTPVWYFSKYALILVATCFVKLILGICFKIRYKNDNSSVTKTVMLDSFLDCGITLTALISFTLSNSIGFALDGIFGLAISIAITVSGIRLVFSSIAQLIGKQTKDYIEKILSIIKEINNEIKIKSVVVHDYGNEKKIADIYLVKSAESDIFAIQNNIKTKLSDVLELDSAIEWEEKQ